MKGCRGVEGGREKHMIRGKNIWIGRRMGRRRKKQKVVLRRRGEKSRRAGWTGRVMERAGETKREDDHDLSYLKESHVVHSTR
jgi:hypothetical protein